MLADQFVVLYVVSYTFFLKPANDILVMITVDLLMIICYDISRDHCWLIDDDYMLLKMYVALWDSLWMK